MFQKAAKYYLKAPVCHNYRDLLTEILHTYIIHEHVYLFVCIALEMAIYNYVGADLTFLEADIFALWQLRADKLGLQCIGLG